MLITRQQIEQWEHEHLAPYATLSASSKGRMYDEAPPKYRTEYQRDRDRILHTTAFRRLEYKTQVFINYEGDHYRTRLTHTLEVAQIGRSIALGLAANVDLTEAICLVHDIGHPPFGHAGEEILDQLMATHGGFEHNRQTYRVVTELEQRYPHFEGLNLTYETLEGITKHKAKANSYETKTTQGHIEAQIADVADSLAYTAHDLDDGLRSGMLTPDSLKHLALWQAAIHQSAVTDEGMLTDRQRHQIIRGLIGYEIHQLLEHTELTINHYHLTNREKIIKHTSYTVGYDDVLTQQNRALKDYLFENLYQHSRVMRMTVKAEKIITDLFQQFIEKPTILPEHIQTRIPKVGLERTVCDYIAGMTDRYAIDEHQKIFNNDINP
jgi:dGTPase